MSIAAGAPFCARTTASDNVSLTYLSRRSTLLKRD